ncbi:MAG: hypothetical protein A3F54_02930 [Candidatus Kerfeldbacteria bacterium RIFCSPHIGHO2_12_FULL_48_17]|uniref:Cell division protein FtsL n=1 Tax=Candidatus Kerfeldbacteria bacterium RIFCSPHIGHO2_12_FULL_48_17 TaxID=1798542 RepID=A0A1G2B847_9BACT|nr:MAG: hypothetical protein A3F54_02930 [Candidatus Kerfeldbacteria bacterium RIFCSPHIGHO2_12_FULL_48_17]
MIKISVKRLIFKLQKYFALSKILHIIRGPKQGILVRLMILVLLAGVGVTYLGLINNTASRGFDVKALEQRVNGLKLENKNKELETAELSSLEHIQEKVSGFGMVPTDHTEYATQDSNLVLSN